MKIERKKTINFGKDLQQEQQNTHTQELRAQKKTSFKDSQFNSWFSVFLSIFSIFYGIRI